MKTLLLLAVLVYFENAHGYMRWEHRNWGCNEGWTRVGDQCYNIRPGVKVDFETASRKCSAEGGMLASIHGKENLKALQEALPRSYRYPVWIGGYREKDNATKWHWTDSSEFIFAKWGPKQPDKASDNCITLNRFRHLGKPLLFDNDNCLAERAYLCSRPLFRDFPYSQFSYLKRGQKCPKKFSHKIGDQCFKFVDDRVSFEQASYRCSRLGGWLPSVHSKSMVEAMARKMIKKTYKRQVWIGGYRTHIGSTHWHWTDSTWFNYANWGPRQPSSRWENCITINNVNKRNKDKAKFYNTNCWKRRAFVCGIKANNFGYAYAG